MILLTKKFSQSSITETPEDPTKILESDDLCDDKVQPYMIMPYAGKQGEKIMSKIVRKMPENVRPKIVYNGTKLSTFFSVKDKVKIEHQSNIIYYYKKETDENITYTGETKVRFGKRITEHQGRDKGSSIVGHFTKKGLPPPSPSEFRILARNYNNRLKRRIAESLFIKENKSTLNKQADAYKLKLFN